MSDNTTNISLEFTGGRGGEEELADAISGGLERIGATLINLNGTNVCEGCSHCRYPGIRWPASPDSNSELSWVERCDYCERHDNDLDAAIYAALDMGCGVGIARCTVYGDIGGEIGEILVSAEARYGRMKLTEAWSNAGPGTALFLDRPERDGQEVSA